MGFMSAVGSMAKDAGESALGIVSKALLILHNPPGMPNNPNEPYKPPTTEEISKMTMLRLAYDADAKNKPYGPERNPLGRPKLLEVQYNPSSVTITANSQATYFQYLQQNFDSSIPAQNLRDPAVVLSVDLTFDAMNPKDAFMLDKLRLSTGGAVSSISGIFNNVKGTGYSVQPQTNGLLAASIRDTTRNVTFKWADMCFTGELTEVNATYSMFSVSGKPIRSVVRLNITQQLNTASDISYWNDAFNRSFGNESEFSTYDGRSTGSKYGNLVNIGF